MTIKELLKELDWSVYRFAVASGIGHSTAINIAEERFPDSSSYKLARLWLLTKLDLEKIEDKKAR